MDGLPLPFSRPMTACCTPDGAWRAVTFFASVALLNGSTYASRGLAVALEHWLETVLESTQAGRSG